MTAGSSSLLPDSQRAGQGPRPLLSSLGKASSERGGPTLVGRRLRLRPLVYRDFKQWREVRVRNRDWLRVWEPRKPPDSPDVDIHRGAFAARCSARDQERTAGSGWGFGVFVGDSFAGEMNITSVVRGPFQSCNIGYWIDRELAGNGYIPEAVVLGLRFVFEELLLHRAEIAIVPRNQRSLRVVEKLGLRSEGVSEGFLEINGVWEDHARFAITSEEWTQRSSELSERWL